MTQTTGDNNVYDLGAILRDFDVTPPSHNHGDSEIPALYDPATYEYIVTEMDETTKAQLYQLANLGRQHGLDDAVRWLMARMLDAENAYIVTEMDETTKAQLYQLANLGRQHGLDDAVRWLMARMLDAENAGKRRRRMRRVQLLDASGKPARAGTFYVPAEVLREAEEL